MERLLTTREAAARLHVHPDSVERWAREGLLPVVRLDRRLRFDPVDVDRFANERKTAHRTRVEYVPERERPRRDPADYEPRLMPLPERTRRKRGRRAP